MATARVDARKASIQKGLRRVNLYENSAAHLPDRDGGYRHEHGYQPPGRLERGKGRKPTLMLPELDGQRHDVNTQRAAQLPGKVDGAGTRTHQRSEEHTSELQSRPHLVCRLLL